VPVTDAQGRLVGVIPRVTLLEAMVPPETSTPPRGTPVADDPAAAADPGDPSDAPETVEVSA
jgi:glycine betaine/proline transport system ATP-binding protein